ncbi:MULTISPECIES: SUKH-3 domain-containing protein [unclassified Streptomyces]|uniref:SUKH-3 domain-containing protein n=1 Tax=unclassified Streptomyces TaxID=2593676 RepID=UPI0036A92C7D
MDLGSNSFWGTEPAVRDSLEAAGWHPERQVDITRWVDMLEERGFRLNALALRIWENLGGLRIRSSPVRDPQSSLYIDPVDACIDAPEESEKLAEVYGASFSPLGMWSIQHRSWISESGRVLAIGPGIVWELGTSFPEVLHFVVIGEAPPRVLSGGRREAGPK